MTQMDQHPRPSTEPIVVICGGVGAARLLRGLQDVHDPQAITAIVNVADDMVLHGLSVSPDLDTIMYTLADAIDPERGWGLREETWQAMEALGRYGDRNWFSLGDKDLATHLQRTARLDEGADLTTITSELCEAWGVSTRLLPVTNDPVSTMVTRADTGDEVSFQEYFVGLQHGVPVSEVRFAGIESATPTDAVLDAISGAARIIIAPSNPIVSIDPVLGIPGIRPALREARGHKVGVSPIIGGEALKGPAADLLHTLGHEVSALGVARMWADIVDVFLIDDADARLARPVASTGVVPFVTDTIMATPERRAGVARAVLATTTGAESTR